MDPSQRTRAEGWACVAGGVLLALAGVLLDSQLSGEVVASTPTGRLAFGLWAVAVPGLMAGVVGLRALHPAGPRALSSIATWVTSVALILWMIGALYSVTDPSVDQAISPAGGALSVVGMVAFGIAVLRAGRLRGWRRFVPLLVGVWWPLQLPVQIVYFLGVLGSPSFTLWFGGLGALWALLGYVVASSAEARPAAGQSEPGVPDAG